MTRIIAKWLLAALGLLIASVFVPGISVSTISAALIGALVLGIVNLLIRPVILLLTLPINLLTLGLFTFVINAVLFAFAASFVTGFAVHNLTSALLGSLVVSIVSFIGGIFVDRD